MTSVRLYGREQGWGSHAQVTNGFHKLLLSQVIDYSFYALDSVDWDSEQPGAFAEHGVFTGALGEVPRMVRNARHKRRWVMVAPNSDYFPDALQRAIGDIATDIMAPSLWAAGMMSHHYPGRFIHTVPHGVSEHFKPELCKRGYGHERFVVLHFSSSDRQRKGTFELVQAWNILNDRGKLANHMLCCMLDEPARNDLVGRLLDERITIPGNRLTIGSRLDFEPKSMARVFQRAHLVCQPSRGEAFGMIPLEALACGTPVVVTTCTGHSQWVYQAPMAGQKPLPALRPGVTPIETGPRAPIDDGPHAQAPGLDPEAIADALENAIVNWTSLERDAVLAAPALGKEWAWSAQLAEWMKELGVQFTREP